ncbi:DUF4366 domain-containing protein [Enterococcus plantarum]|uniref:CD1107 family mobile element protein n=1 Tax=Enterococcus plantarum TaxID=1077675 RepID=UPI001A8F5E2F|nr:DUF4366 domain-containing protein [Enterococcus plantarum]MBO0468554.1 DUF4366 domain-containing protein [Enterococcus plantarum]
MKKRIIICLLNGLLMGFGLMNMNTSNVFAQDNLSTYQEDVTENTAPAENDATETPVAPVPVVPENPDVVNEGGGSVVESSVNSPTPTSTTEKKGKEFFTVKTKDEKIFYIVVDNEKAADNVYLLTAVTEQDLQNFTNENEATLKTDSSTKNDLQTPITPKESTPSALDISKPDTPKNKKEEKQTSDSTLMLIVVIVVGLFGGAVYYFRIIKPKKELQYADDLDDFEFEEEPMEDNFEYDEFEIDDLEDDE